MDWTKVVHAVCANWVFLAGVILLPGFVLLLAAIVRHGLHRPWTAAADAFIALATLEFGLLYDIDVVSQHINPVFSQHFVPTFTLLALATLVLMVWALFVEKEATDSSNSRTSVTRKIFILWTCALTLVSANLYVLAGLGGWKK
jgi:hypothetical protein